MDMITEKAMEGAVLAERRADPRRRVLKGATLTFNRGYGALQCVVRNESGRGALLAFGDTSAVPSAFDLAIKGGNGPRAARVRWRTMTAVGIEFG
jgi:hypothetical protein